MERKRMNENKINIHNKMGEIRTIDSLANGKIGKVAQLAETNPQEVRIRLMSHASIPAFHFSDNVSPSGR